MPTKTMKVNRAPVMTLWAAVVAERLGHDPDAALTLGKAVAGLNAHAKGRRLGIYEEPPDQPEETAAHQHPPGDRQFVTVLGRAVPVVQTDQGVRATVKGQPVEPVTVRRYLERAFGRDLIAVQAALEALAQAYPSDQLAAHAYALYEQFRPAVPEGTKGWGAKGDLHLDAIRTLAKKGRGSAGSTARPAARDRTNLSTS
jgi:hypothetical protein